MKLLVRQQDVRIAISRAARIEQPLVDRLQFGDIGVASHNRLPARPPLPLEVEPQFANLVEPVEVHHRDPDRTVVHLHQHLIGDTRRASASRTGVTLVPKRLGEIAQLQLLPGS